MNHLGKVVVLAARQWLSDKGCVCNPAPYLTAAGGRIPCILPEAQSQMSKAAGRAGWQQGGTASLATVRTTTQPAPLKTANCCSFTLRMKYNPHFGWTH